MNAEEIKKRLARGRKIEHLDQPDDNLGIPELRVTSTAVKQDDSFNLIKTLQGTWETDDKGWNLIALPFKDPSAPGDYRLLMNQYAETLSFGLSDINVPNRGIDPDASGETTQLIDAIDYMQLIEQVDSDDFPPSTLREDNGGGLHHEPGLFLQVLNHQSSAVQGKGKSQGPKLEVARMGNIPHGDSVLAMGTVEIIDGPPIIPNLDALPLRTTQDLSSGYLAPYKHYEDDPFFGKVPQSVPGFPGFFSTNANAILQFALDGFKKRVKKTTVLHFDTKFGKGGIVNIPFIVKQADATEMVATFWIMELEPENGSDPEFVMQYSQTVFLDFFPSKNDEKKIRWPHVSINTLSFKKGSPKND